MARAADIEFRINGVVREEDIPSNAYSSALSRLLKKLAETKAGEFIRLGCLDDENAEKLRVRLYAVSKGNFEVRYPKGGRFVYVGVKHAPKPKRKKRK